jgi:hypothetical protein
VADNFPGDCDNGDNRYFQCCFCAGPQSGTNSGQCDTGLRGGQGWNGVSCIEAVTDLLGLSQEEICELRQDGQSLVEIAAGKGITEDALVEAILKERQEEIESKVDSGILTQEQADLRLANMEENITEAVNRTTTGPNGNFQGSGYGQSGNGMMQRGQRGAQGQYSDAPGDCTGAGSMQRFNRNGN